MSTVIKASIETADTSSEKYANGKYQVKDGEQQIIVIRYATPSRKSKVERKIKGHQTHDANLVYPWHRGYGKVGT